MSKRRKRSCLGGIFRMIFWLAALGVLGFVGLFGYVLVKEYTVPKPGSYNAIIVLGAQVDPSGSPSVQLEWRLQKALELYQQNRMPIAVTGGQGKDEPATEASVMRDWLIQRGVLAQDIVVDEQSTDTKQNIKNALDALPQGTLDVMIVTSDYHLPRALQVARDQGLNPSGAGSPIKPEYWFKNHFRETLAWGKYILSRFIPI